MVENIRSFGLQEPPVFSSCMPMFASAYEAWRYAIDNISSNGYETEGVTDPKSVGSRFGVTSRSTREVIATGFTIKHPRNRLIFSRARMIDLGFAIANTIWTFGASDRVDEISFYNSKGWNFSEDGRTLSAAIGRRIFASPAGDQLASAISRLEEDKTSRRALISIFTSNDLINNNKDCPCFGSLQFFIRDDKLQCLTFMRSQSAIMVLPYDLFLLTFYHELVASVLGIECGNYTHFCGSLHYYKDEEYYVEKILNESEMEECISNSRMPEMPKASYKIIGDVSEAEKSIRMDLSNNIEAKPNFDSLEFDSYWSDILNALTYSVKTRHGARDLGGLSLANLANPYRSFLNFAAQHERSKFVGEK